MKSDQRDVRVGLVVGELVQPLGEGVVVGVHPGVRRVGADELEAQRADAAPAGHLDGLELRAGDPQRRMRLLDRLGQDVAQREVEVRAVILAAAVPEHRDDAAHRVLPDRALVLEVDAERLQLGDPGALAHAELDAAVAEQVERGDLLGDRGGMVGGQLEDAVAQADVLGALAGGGEEDLRRRGVRVFLQEVVLDLPGVVVAEPVGESSWSARSGRA